MVIVITGASRGIGKSIATAFAPLCTTLVLCSKNMERLTATAEELKDAFPDVAIELFSADLSEQKEVEKFATWCAKFDAPDILVNNAGIFLPGKLLEQSAGDMQAMMNTNFWSTYYLTQALLPAMIAKGTGHVFNICSIAALKAYDNGGGYSVSKFAMDGYSKNLRYELLTKGIKVTGVYPGAVLTDAWGDFDNSEGRIMEASDIAQMIVAAATLSPQATVEDIVIRPQLGDL